MEGCTGVGMDSDNGALELVTVLDVGTACVESNVVMSEFNDVIDSFGFEVNGTTLVVLDVLPFPETFEVELRVKLAQLD